MQSGHSARHDVYVDDAGILVACERLGDFVRHLLRARGLEQQDVVRRVDGEGEHYISQSTLTITANPYGRRNASSFNERTWRRLELALEVEPGTLRAVYATEDHGVDPETTPVYRPRRTRRATTARPVGLSPAELQAAERIAERAANGHV